MSTLRECQAEIAVRMRRGEKFASVEEELIDASSFSEREKAALWLFGWSFVNGRRQRREAVRHIELVAAEGEPDEVAGPLLGWPTSARHADRATGPRAARARRPR